MSIIVIVKCHVTNVSIIFFPVHAHIKFVRKGRGGLVYDTKMSAQIIFIIRILQL